MILRYVCLSTTKKHARPSINRFNVLRRWASSSTNPRHRWKHDVFLSFYGKDTRRSFVDHLFSALVDKGIRAFKDDVSLNRGKSITTELKTAIRESRFAIPVFSKSYAFSPWCLEELVEIIECKNTFGQTVLPVFYDVDPTEVRNQTGNYAAAFAEHEETFKEEMEKVEKWRKALKEGANIAGWDTRIVANGHEAECIKQVVGELLKSPHLIYWKSIYRYAMLTLGIALLLFVFGLRLLYLIGNDEEDNEGIYFPLLIGVCFGLWALASQVKFVILYLAITRGFAST